MSTGGVGRGGKGAQGAVGTSGEVERYIPGGEARLGASLRVDAAAGGCPHSPGTTHITLLCGGPRLSEAPTLRRWFTPLASDLQ